MNAFPTPADLLAQGLRLPLLPEPPRPIPGGGWCAITGQPLTAGYRVADVTSTATAEFLDTFHGDAHGWVSENAARCYKNADPRQGNPTAKSFFIFPDGPAEQPLLDRDAEAHAREALAKAQAKLAAAGPEDDREKLEKAVAAAEKRILAVQGRPCWSDLVRQVWPVHQGKICLVLLTTDTKKRLWPRARVGALGAKTPVYLHDGALSRVEFINWPGLLRVLDLVEEVYAAGFSKSYLRAGLYGATQALAQVGYRQMASWEQALYGLRPLAEFQMALLIAQKKEIP